jgi:hypothetical protein
MLKPLVILLGCLLVAGGGTYALYTQTDMLSGGGCKGSGCPSSQALSGGGGCCATAAESEGCCSHDEQQVACAADAVAGPAVFAASAKKTFACCESDAPTATGLEAVAGIAAAVNAHH